MNQETLKETSALQVFTECVSKNFKENSKDGFGGEVLIKRKSVSTDRLEDATEEELQVLSTKARLAETAQMIKDLSSKEKLQWAITAKENANVLFKQKQFHDAIKIYVECLAAADFGSDIKSCENLDTLVLPVVCNLAACSIELKEWRKVVSFCDQALDFRPRCAKALYRKSVALLELGDYDSALAALHCIDIQPNQEVGSKSGGSDVSMPLSEQEASKVPGLLVRARNGIRRQKEHAQQQKQALVRAFNKSSLRSEPGGPHSSDGDLHKQAPAVIEKETMKMMTAWELFSYFLRSFIYFVRRLFSPTKRLKKES